MCKREDLRRKRKQKKIVKDSEIIAFIDVLTDLFPYNQYRDEKRALFYRSSDSRERKLYL